MTSGKVMTLTLIANFELDHYFPPPPPHHHPTVEYSLTSGRLTAGKNVSLLNEPVIHSHLHRQHQNKNNDELLWLSGSKIMLSMLIINAENLNLVN